MDLTARWPSTTWRRRLAVGHLVGQDHRNIAFVGGPMTIQQVRDRHLGAQLALHGSGGLGSPHSNPSRAVVMKRYIRIVCVTVSEEIFVAWRVILTEGLDCAAETLESVPVRFVEGLHHSRPTVWQGILTPVERGRYRQFYTVCNVSMTKESRVNVAVSRSGSPNPRTS